MFFDIFALFRALPGPSVNLEFFGRCIRGAFLDPARRAGHPGIQASRHPGIRASRHPGIQASRHPGIRRTYIRIYRVYTYPPHTYTRIYRLYTYLLHIYVLEGDMAIYVPPVSCSTNFAKKKAHLAPLSFTAFIFNLTVDIS